MGRRSGIAFKDERKQKVQKGDAANADASDSFISLPH